MKTELNKREKFLIMFMVVMMLPVILIALIPLSIAYLLTWLVGKLIGVNLKTLNEKI